MSSTDEWIIYLGSDLPLICHFFPFFFCPPNQITMGYMRGLRTDTMILKAGQKEGE